MLPRLRIPMALCALIALASCHHVVMPGSADTSTETLIQWSPNMRTAALVGPIGCVGLGLLLWHAARLRVLGFALVLAGSVGIPIGLDLRTDQIVVTESEIFEVHGPPWSREKRGIALENLRRCTVVPEPQEYSASRGDEHRWSLEFVDSEQNHAIYPSSLWVRATEEILKELEARNIECFLVGDGP